MGSARRVLGTMELDCSVGAVYVPPFGKSLYGPTPNAARPPPAAAPSDEYTRTKRPMVTGTSVLAIRFKDGVVVAADTLASYGSLARYRDVRRMEEVSGTLVAGGGDYSDLQEVLEMSHFLSCEDYWADDGNRLTPQELHSYLARVLYQRRSKMDPLWNELIVAGVGEDGTPFLGQCDLHGTSFQDNTLATGYGAHIARPLLRERFSEDLDEDGAVAIIEECMKIMFYRDARTINNIQVARVKKDNVSISEPYSLPTYWMHGEAINRDGAF